MELSTPANERSALASTTPTPLAQLSPSLDSHEERHIRAIVILLWPYSSCTKQFSLLLAEPDFRLRDRKGQVRVSFRDVSAEAVAKSQVGIGDIVVLSLDGARWQNHDAEISTPGKGVDWDITFSSHLLLEVYRDSELFTTVKVEAPCHERQYFDGNIPATPHRSPSTPQPHTNGDTIGPLTPENWVSPAFSRKFSNSFGSLSNSTFNPLEDEDGYIWGKGRKRTKFSRPSSEWVFVDTPPSPPPLAATGAWEDADLGIEDDEQYAVMDDHPVQTDTVPNSQARALAVDGTQEDEASCISEPPKQLLQTENMDSCVLEAGPNISGTFNTAFDYSQTEGSTATITQNASWNTALSQQPTITPFSSFGNSFEHEQPLAARLSPILSSMASTVNPLEETPFADTGNNILPSGSPPSSQFHVYNTPTPQHITPKHGVALTVDETGYELRYKDETTIEDPKDVHYMSSHPPNSIGTPASATPVLDFDKQEQFEGEIAETDHAAPETCAEGHDEHITESHSAERQAALTMSPGVSGRGNEVDQDMVGEEDEDEEEIEENNVANMRERLAEHVEEKHDEALEEKISRRPAEDLEEELAELEEEMEERVEKEQAEVERELVDLEEDMEEQMEEELAEEEMEEDLDIYSGDEMDRTSSEGSPQLESEETYDEGSELESEEDTYPPGPTYFAGPNEPPEIIVLDSDDEDEGGSVNPPAPQHVELLSSGAPPALADIARAGLPHHDITAADFAPNIEMGESSCPEAAGYEPEPTLLTQDFGSPSLEPDASFDGTSRRETGSYLADTSLHIQPEPAAADSEYEVETHHKSDSLGSYHHASPSFSSGSVSDSELDAEHNLPNGFAIDPQLYRPGNRKSPGTDSEIQSTVDHGLSHDGTTDVDDWNKSGILVPQDSKDRLATSIETRQSADIPPSPPSANALLTDDELVALQLFRDMEAQEGRRNLQAPDLGDEMSLPSLRPPEEEEARMSEYAGINDTAKDDIYMPNRKPAGDPDSIRKAVVEPSTIFQPNTNATGLRSRLSYFFPLSTLADNFNRMTDTISVVFSASKISQSSKGPREYYATLHLTDPSMSGITVCAQIFRRTKSSLPATAKGDIILLRDFKVQSMDHKMMLLSMAASAWAVFPAGSDTDVQMNASPVEFGPEEREYVTTLRQWYKEEGEQLAEKHEYLIMARGSTETSSSISSATSSNLSRGRGSIFKKYARRSRKSRHRRITIHELRDGRRYAEVGSPADKEMIHELRDGTVYANL
ncbi:hypothetical protein AJ78_04746 [Emergomyces pasteurianus Ep9510]|uniref:Telomeric single stranded DNA binding POT1/Cdc13 domain-containing protein n=1 Tax=Emergomyces pasteurianus Ep9510 TaxID=1447872 RepID=A0A1J9Q441_9EURO|nr:hypothetical protein AJ78_04746 [Emergomyces pasteurianus Ep9510]